MNIPKSSVVEVLFFFYIQIINILYSQDLWWIQCSLSLLPHFRRICNFFPPGHVFLQHSDVPKLLHYLSYFWLLSAVSCHRCTASVLLYFSFLSNFSIKFFHHSSIFFLHIPHACFKVTTSVFNIFLTIDPFCFESEIWLPLMINHIWSEASLVMTIPFPLIRLLFPDGYVSQL